MTNKEHIAGILTEEVSQAELHQRRLSAEEIRVRKALMWLAEQIDNLEQTNLENQPTIDRQSGRDWDDLMSSGL